MLTFIMKMCYILVDLSERYLGCFFLGQKSSSLQMMCGGWVKNSWFLLAQFTLNALLHHMEHNFFSDTTPSQTNKRNYYILLSFQLQFTNLCLLVLFDMH
jgi:hypothetical protein